MLLQNSIWWHLLWKIRIPGYFLLQELLSERLCFRVATFAAHRQGSPFEEHFRAADFEGQPYFLHGDVCDVPCCVVSDGRLFTSGLDVNLSSRNPNILSTPEGHKVPIIRHGSLLFLRPTLAPFSKEESEVVCNTFHNTNAQGILVASKFFAALSTLILLGKHVDANPHSHESYVLFSHNRSNSKNFRQRPYKHFTSSPQKASRSKAPRTVFVCAWSRLSEGFA